MALTVGVRLGPYEIVAPLGAGGMGEVFKARDTRLDRTVAIKVLKSALGASADLKARFEREARTISHLNHPNICALYDVGHENGTDYLVMEYLEGETLSDRLRRGPVPLNEFVKIGSDIAAALDSAHRAGIVHRDLKPSNVMLAKTGTKLLDFGLAKATAFATSAGAPSLSAAMTTDARLTSVGSIVGTLQYMSPQQIEGKEIDARSDIFSFGSILYEMATGVPAFSGKSQVSVASAILEREPESLSLVMPTSPPALEYVIRTCLAKNPEERYQSAADIRLQLRWVLQSQQAGPLVRAHAGWRSYVVAATLCIAAAFVTWWVASRSSAKPEPMYVTIPVASGSPSGTFNTPIVISPDGRWLVSLVKHEGRRSLFIRAFSQAEGRLMEGTDGAISPFFSFDSRWVVFSSNGSLNKIAIGGGPPIKICTLPLGDDALGFIGGTWGPDGRIVFVPGFNSGLWEVPATGGTAKLLLKTDALKDRVAATHPQILPNGKGILFTSVPGKARTAEDENIVVLEPGASEPRILIQGGSHAQYLPTGHLVFGSAGKLFAVRFDLARLQVIGDAVPVVEEVNIAPPDAQYSLSENGTLVYVPAIKANNPRLFLMDRKGTRRAITDGSNIPEALAVSPDGRSVVARVIAANDDLWAFDVARGTALRLTFEAGDEIYPQWTPDGTRVAYGTRDGVIYWRPADGSGQREELSRGPFSRYPSSFSPDGKWLAIVESTTAHARDIWILPIGGGDRKPIAFETTESDEWAPKFSPDGRFVSYVSNETGTTEIYLKQFIGSGPRRRLTTSGGQLPVWNRNGRELFFVKDGALMSVGIDANGYANTPERIVIEKSTMGEELDLAALLYDVMPDGQHFVVCLSPQSSTPPEYKVIVNWFEELKRATKQ
jgi:serine/threonine protein kinase/Tol biopolymer transport system component